jgi:hypothetical protein
MPPPRSLSALSWAELKAATAAGEAYSGLPDHLAASLE